MRLFHRIPVGPGPLVPPMGLVHLEKPPGGKPTAVKAAKASVVGSDRSSRDPAAVARGRGAARKGAAAAHAHFRARPDAEIAADRRSPPQSS
ncbi:hypothetical protein ACFP51_16880 [Streptomyces pratens]|uniref:Uncharacterized protein n=1 Tax=Streptomyces pratens TaxID=887456 RepID=A0ABW1M0P5_9ACTN